VRLYKDPTNGRLLWWRSDKKVSELLEQELKKHEIREIMDLVGEE